MSDEPRSLYAESLLRERHESIPDMALRLLDEWAKPEHHIITVQTDAVLPDYFQAVCSCGWRGLAEAFYSQAQRDACPVLDALQERQKRMRR